MAAAAGQIFRYSVALSIRRRGSSERTEVACILSLEREVLHLNVRQQNRTITVTVSTAVLFSWRTSAPAGLDITFRANASDPHVDTWCLRFESVDNREHVVQSLSTLRPQQETSSQAAAHSAAADGAAIPRAPSHAASAPAESSAEHTSQSSESLPQMDKAYYSPGAARTLNASRQTGALAFPHCAPWCGDLRALTLCSVDVTGQALQRDPTTGNILYPGAAGVCVCV